MPRILGVLLFVLAVAAAAAAVNLVLLGYVGNHSDPVGKLKPIAPGLVTYPVQVPTAPRARGGEHEDD